jgi:hypothetical protein
MREDSIKTILEGLGPDGFCIDAGTRLTTTEEGIYVDILLNVGKHGNIVALPLEVLIPTEIPTEAPKKARKKRVKKAMVLDVPLVLEEEPLHEQTLPDTTDED